MGIFFFFFLAACKLYTAYSRTAELSTAETVAMQRKGDPSLWPAMEHLNESPQAIAVCVWQWRGTAGQCGWKRWKCERKVSRREKKRVEPPRLALSSRDPSGSGRRPSADAALVPLLIPSAVR